MMFSIDSKATFIDGRSNGINFIVTAVNDKYYDIKNNRFLEVVDLKFKAFYLVATIRNVPKEILKEVEG